MSGQERNKLVKETSESILNYGRILTKGIEECINSFQMNEEKKALELLVQIIEGLEWIHKALALTNVLKEKDNLDQLNIYYKEIIEAIENRDYILVSDLLEYEIMPLLKEVLNLFNQYYDKSLTEQLN